jgi:4-aminobutyrate aminotransferase/diaminobutyrate-pyruvate transaminase/4-aminobutyrate aminotransferase/(S)-3-amino-2-methylpropionate transaminase
MYLYHRKPIEVEKTETRYRKIKTALPVPESLPILDKLEKYEPQSMLGQPPVIWDRAEGFQVYDPWGNVWIDCAHPRIVNALQEQIDKKLIASYVFYHEKRAKLVELLVSLVPENLNKVFLLSTGSEAVENAIKLARTYAIKKYNREKHVIISFSNAFHGRTLGAQQVGGSPALKEWIVNLDPGFIMVPFPDGFLNEDTRFDVFLNTLEQNHVRPQHVAGVIFESYQGAGPYFLPKDYAKKLEAFCRDNDALLLCDEVQAGFGRTGKWFTFEHYDIIPDLIICGKGISSSLPLAAVIGREDVMNLYKPGSMTSTHSGSPLPVVSAIANIEAMKQDDLVKHAAQMEAVLMNGLKQIQQKHRAQIGFISGMGLVAGLQIVKSGTDREPDAITALGISEKCFQKGLLMFAPVGVGGMCIKICPPLSIPRDALEEGIQVLDQVCDEVLD